MALHKIGGDSLCMQTQGLLHIRIVGIPFCLHISSALKSDIAYTLKSIDIIGVPRKGARKVYPLSNSL